MADEITVKTTSSPWLDVADVAARLGVSRSFVYTVAREGKLRVCRLAGRRTLRFHVDDVDAFVRDAATGGQHD